jgi:magnesium transporter
LPVVDEDDRLIGAITQADALEAMKEMSDETIASIGGTAEGVSEDEPAWRRFLLRAPWLSVTLCAGLFTATGFSLFQGQPWFLAVPFFVPLIAGMSGNVGIQCSTVFIRSMATGEISPRTVHAAVAREIRLGVLLGLTFGIICGCAAYALHKLGIHKSPVDPLFVGFAVSSGVLGACFTSTLLGTLSPLLFARFRIDPALASGPIVAACNDVVSTYMYFFIAWMIATIFHVV